MGQPDDSERQRRRRRNVWQLDIPLVLVLVLCTVITVIEYRRANEGVWRAWIYLFEWPLIAAFAVWMWYRFTHEGSGGGFVRRWKERVARFEAEADAQERDERAAQADEARRVQEANDPQLQAWREYQRSLREQEQPPS